jgi:hypothetical protein
MTEQQQHPSSPPAELRVKWRKEAPWDYRDYDQLSDYIIAQAAQWAWDQREPEIQAAADAELEACCEWLRTGPHRPLIACHAEQMISDLRAARRPKPSLKEQALEALKAHFDAMEAGVPTYQPAHKAIIRRALAALPE